MNKVATGAWVAALTALVTLFATNGKPLVEAAHAAWLFLLELAKGAPLGLSSFLLALALAVGVQPFLRRYIAVRCDASRDFISDSAAIVIGVGVMWLQMRTLDALLMGLLAGFSAPWVFRGLAAMFGLAARAVKMEKSP